MTLDVWTNGAAVTEIAFHGRGQRQPETPFEKRVADQLGEYARGERRAFSVPVEPTGTPFQMAVWRELRRIPYGETRTYGAVARAVGRPKAARAVGMANHDNPIPVVIPCHRVVGADGKLTGFGGGLELKRALLELEGAVTGQLV